MNNFNVDDIRALILDFDGTMCHLFKNYDLYATSLLLCDMLKKYQLEFDPKKDAFDVFEDIRKQTGQDPAKQAEALREADKILTEAECMALNSAKIVEGLKSLPALTHGSGLKIGVATNNSSKCVEIFLQQIFPETFMPIRGRVGTHPEWLKPDTKMVTDLLEDLGCKPWEAVLLGDSQRDFECASKVGCHFVGMGSTERKYLRLKKLIPKEWIVRNYRELGQLLKLREIAF